MLSIFGRVKKPQYTYETFDTMLSYIQSSNETIHFINILPVTKQQYLLPKTISAESEEQFINDFVDTMTMDIPTIVIYGNNANDVDVLQEKCRELNALGFTNVGIYLGGLFEWTMLGDIYGITEFPIIGNRGIVDILQFRPKQLEDTQKKKSMLFLGWK